MTEESPSDGHHRHVPKHHRHGHHRHAPITQQPQPQPLPESGSPPPAETPQPPPTGQPLPPPVPVSPVPLPPGQPPLPQVGWRDAQGQGPPAQPPFVQGLADDPITGLLGAERTDKAGRWIKHQLGHDVITELFDHGPPQGQILEEAKCRDALEANLKLTDAFYIEQKFELVELITAFEMQNQYLVFNNMGIIFLDVMEESEFLTRQCCGANRALDMTFKDRLDRPAMAITRDFAFCCPPMDVFYPPGNFIGRVKQEFTIPCDPRFVLTDHTETTVMTLKGPACPGGVCCNDVNFEILSTNGEIIGRITKVWAGYVQEAFTDTDIMGAQFDINLPLEYKVLILGITFLLDYAFYERGRGDRGGYQGGVGVGPPGLLTNRGYGFGANRGYGLGAGAGLGAGGMLGMGMPFRRSSSICSDRHNFASNQKGFGFGGGMGGFQGGIGSQCGPGIAPSSNQTGFGFGGNMGGIGSQCHPGIGHPSSQTGFGFGGNMGGIGNQCGTRISPPCSHMGFGGNMGGIGHHSSHGFGHCSHGFGH